MYEHCPSLFGWVYKVFESISKDANSTSYTQLKSFHFKFPEPLLFKRAGNKSSDTYEFGMYYIHS